MSIAVDDGEQDIRIHMAGRGRLGRNIARRCGTMGYSTGNSIGVPRGRGRVSADLVYQPVELADLDALAALGPGSRTDRPDELARH